MHSLGRNVQALNTQSNLSSCARFSSEVVASVSAQSAATSETIIRDTDDEGSEDEVESSAVP
jgi:hypothetical protein